MLPFDLTTYASASGIDSVLSQNKRPIAMISRTLKDCELNYATNERELLAIVWAIGANGKVFNTPGKQNLVADALSRQTLEQLRG